MRTGNYDVLIVGGGPAGATLGALLARSGWSVGLLERERLEFYRSAIEKSIYTRQMLSGAVMTGELRCIADYSYRPRRLWGPGFLLAGDAGNFIDPVWSTGVMLATTGARLAARAIERAFRGQTCEPLAEYEAAIQRLVGRYRQFIYFFYRTNALPDSYFWEAHSMIPEAADPKDAFIRLISGRLGL